MRKRKVLLLIAGGLLLLGVCYFRWVPWGASAIPYLAASVDEGHRIPGENYAVVYNDAGAAHSGQHWTWVVADRGLFRQVVAEGYSDRGVRSGDTPIPVRKRDGRTEIGFVSGRHSADRVWVTLP